MALQKHLEARADRPAVVKASAPKKGDGTIVTTLAKGLSGEVFLKNAAGKVFRLTWAKADESGRHLAPGTYTLTGYRLVQGEWFLSTTGGKTKLEVKSERTTRLELDPKIRIKLRAQRRKHGRVFLGMTIQNDRKQGVSLYRMGKRIPIPYRFKTQAGDQVGAGKMNYG